jgi:hypothetical protein
MKRMRIMTVAVVILFLSGCAGSSMLVRQSLKKDLTPYRILNFAVDSKLAEDVSEEQSNLEAEVAARVKKLNFFSSVELGEPKDSSMDRLFVKATISDIRKVSGTARFLAGAFAGQASLTTDVLFIDLVAKDTLGSFQVKGQSGGTGLSGGTGDAVKKCAQGLVDLISKHRSR